MEQPIAQHEALTDYRFRPDTSALADRIQERLRQHLDPATIAPVLTALMRGRVVRLDGATGGLIAYKRGVLFVAGIEYVITDE